jgi:hypothetical protein
MSSDSIITTFASFFDPRYKNNTKKLTEATSVSEQIIADVVKKQLLQSTHQHRPCAPELAPQPTSESDQREKVSAPVRPTAGK